MNIEEKLTELGYKTEKYSSWIGDKDKRFLCKGETLIASINIKNNSLHESHGYSGHLKSLAKKIGAKYIKY